MSEFVILTDSSCDFPAELAERLQVQALPLAVFIDDNTYYNHLDHRDITPHAFYEKLKTAKDVKTSAINQSRFLEWMEPIVASGKDLIYFGFSSGLSANFSASMIAINELREKYPERKLFAIDTLSASLGQGLLIYLACQKKQAGATIEEVRDFAESMIHKIAHWFTVDNLMFLKRGGRISASTAIVGSVLSIKPVMHMDDEGHLVKTGIARGRKASIRALVAEMEKTAIDPVNQTVFISHGDCVEDAEFLAALIREKTGVKDIIIGYVGPVIGAHSGPGTLALFFVANHR